MNFDLASMAYAQTTGETARQTAPIWPMMLVLIAIFYFFIIRPQGKKQKDTQKMLATLEKGDRVITIGGIVGTIVSIKGKKEGSNDDDVVVLKIGETTKLEFIRSSIARVMEKGSKSVKEVKE